MLLSIIIPTRDRMKYLDKMLLSIRQQSLEKKEIIIVDDNSNEDYSYLLKKYAKYFEIIYLKNGVSCGPAKCREIGLRKAKGKYIVFADDDDFYIDDYFFEEGVNFLNENEELSFFSSNSYNYFEKSKDKVPNILSKTGRINNVEYAINFQKNFSKPESTFTTIFVKKILLDNFNKSLWFVNDATIYLTALTEKDCFISKKIVGCYRIHDSNISKTIDEKFIISSIKSKLNLANSFLFNKHEKKEYRFNQIIVTTNYYFNTIKGKYGKIKFLFHLIIKNIIKIDELYKIIKYYKSECN